MTVFPRELLELMDAVARAAAVDLQLGLAGPAAADAAGQARHHRALLVEPRERVLELRQLDLQLAVAAPRALCEDVEDELRAVDRLETGRVLEGAFHQERRIASLVGAQFDSTLTAQ